MAKACKSFLRPCEYTSDPTSDSLCGTDTQWMFNVGFISRADEEEHSLKLCMFFHVESSKAD